MIYITLFFAFLYIVFILYLIGSTYLVIIKTQKNLELVDYFVVLGFILKNGNLRPEFIARCDTAIALWKKFPQKPIAVFAGTLDGTDRSQGEAAREYLLSQGLLAEKIFIASDFRLPSAQHTGEELLFASKLSQNMHFRKPLIISNFWHLVQCRCILGTSNSFFAASSLKIKGPFFIPVRLLIIAPLCWLDPSGKSNFFQLFRLVRDRIFGSKA